MASFRGYPCSPELAEWLTWYERVLLAVGNIKYNVDVFQLRGNYYKSGNTHSDGYAFDIAQCDDEALDIADEMGAFSWPRGPEQGFKWHQHGGLYGIDDMNAALAGQGRDRKNGWNGLVGKHRARDPRPVSGRDWREGVEWAKEFLAAHGKPVKQPDSVTLSDPRINESSALAHSVKHPHIIYTLNDENGPIYTIDTRTGKTVGSFTLKGVTLKDPESMACRADGVLWIAATGDNDLERDDATLYVLAEPGPGHHGPLAAEKYLIGYPGGPRNVEAFLINPLTLHRYLVSKDASGDLYRSKVGTLNLGMRNMLEHVGTRLVSYITDACFSVDGRFVFARQKGKVDTVTVLDGVTWRYVDRFTVPKVKQPESITADPDGIHIWIGSEGKGSPLHRVTLPASYRKGGKPPASKAKINWRQWKWTAPYGKPTEVRPPRLATFEDAPWLVRNDESATFRAKAGGAHTSGSKYPRSELRELTVDGTDEASWSNRTGTHAMLVEQAITATPRGKAVVAGQIHDDKDDVVRVILKGSRLYVTFSEGKGKDTQPLILDANYRLGTRFTVQLVADRDGVRVLYNGKRKAHHGRIFSGGYFKAGAYVLSDDPDDEVGEVVIYNLEVTHD